mmetsp:Transcript_132835/g.244204  ORF Transcript_132835/g.244204 Transcript_132835/m.244204 type:complete len:270 (+) Transcript_132835:1865-2674(+)
MSIELYCKDDSLSESMKESKFVSMETAPVMPLAQRVITHKKVKQNMAHGHLRMQHHGIGCRGTLNRIRMACSSSIPSCMISLASSSNSGLYSQPRRRHLLPTLRRYAPLLMSSPPTTQSSVKVNCLSTFMTSWSSSCVAVTLRPEHLAQQLHRGFLGISGNGSSASDLGCNPCEDHEPCELDPLVSLLADILRCCWLSALGTPESFDLSVRLSAYRMVRGVLRKPERAAGMLLLRFSTIHWAWCGSAIRTTAALSPRPPSNTFKDWTRP